MSNEVVYKVIGNYSYQPNYCLGEGVYGKVFEGKEVDTKERVAIKKIDLNTFKNDKYLENAIFSQIYLLKKLNHPNIVRFKDVLTSLNSLYIVTEFCKNGDLKEIIKRRRFKEDEAFDIIRQILGGFTELVQEKIIHRDLKPANILVNDGVYKIADFGFAKYVDNFGTQMLKSCVGSPIYMAPQILQRTHYTTKCDIWSIGIIFYEMLFGYPPWRARDQPELLRSLRTCPIHELVKREVTLSHKAAQFLRRCLAYHEKDRANWNQLFELYLPKVINTHKMVQQNIMDSPTKGQSFGNRNRFSTLNIPSLGTIPNVPINIQPPNMPLRSPLSTQGRDTMPNQVTVSPQVPNSPPILSSPTVNSPPVVNSPPQQQNSAPTNIQNKILQPNLTAFNPMSQVVTPPIASPITTVKLLRQQCVLRHFVNVQLFTTLNQLKQIIPDTYKIEKLLLLICQSTRVKSSACLRNISSIMKDRIEVVLARSVSEILKKVQKQHLTYEELETDITKELEKSQSLRKIKDELNSLYISKNDVVNEDRASRLQKTLIRALTDASQAFLTELTPRTLPPKKSQILVRMLDYSCQLLQSLIYKDKLSDNSLIDSTMSDSHQNYLLRTINKATSLMKKL